MALVAANAVGKIRHGSADQLPEFYFQHHAVQLVTVEERQRACEEVLDCTRGVGEVDVRQRRRRHEIEFDQLGRLGPRRRQDFLFGLFE